MPKSRRTRKALDMEIQKLIDEKKKSEEKAAAVFAKAFLTKEMKNKIADMTDDEIKKLARDLAAKMNQMQAALSNLTMKTTSKGDVKNGKL